jgi:hypothetical protein
MLSTQKFDFEFTELLAHCHKIKKNRLKIILVGLVIRFFIAAWILQLSREFFLF